MGRQDLASGRGAGRRRRRRRTAYHHGDLREALVAAAGRLIGQVGPRGFSMSQACRAASVSPSALYRHFDSKEALLAEVARRGFVGLAAAAAALPPPARRPSAAAAAGRLVDVGLAYVGFAVGHPAAFGAMFGAGLDKATFPDLTAAAAAAEAALLAEAERARAAGAVAGPAAAAATAVWSAAHGVAMLRVDDAHGQHGLDDAASAAVLRAVVAGLRRA